MIAALRGSRRGHRGERAVHRTGPRGAPRAADHLAVRGRLRLHRPGGRGAVRVAVAITPDGNCEAVAEHALAMLLALTRSIVPNDRDVRRGRWLKTPLVPLRGKTIGLVGLGRIGRSVARRAAPFRVTVLGCDPKVSPELARGTVSSCWT